MAKRLLLLRHAQASPALDGDDFRRRLTPRGQANAQALGTAAGALDLAPPTIGLVSPALRADETFTIFANAAGWDPEPVRDPDIYQATPQDIRRLLAPLAPDVVLVVGHNPTLAELATGSVSDGPPDLVRQLRGHFPAPCLAVIRFDVAHWSAIGAEGCLERFLTPEAP